LSEQTVLPSEVILVSKNCDILNVANVCRKYKLPYLILQQREGYFTHALNMGKKAASGDIVVFTDDDSLPPRGWIARYLDLHSKYPEVAGICSRDIYVDPRTNKLVATPDDKPLTKVYRYCFGPWLKLPHSLLKKYRLGVYLSRNMEIVHGPLIPNHKCYSLAFRGVNISFKKDYINDVWFPELPKLKIAIGNEQYFGLQLVLKGLETIYVPENPTLHIERESLSRGKSKADLCNEALIMRSLYVKLIDESRVLTTNNFSQEPKINEISK
jgi:glycosyltransferase involved in cell wall biosynthesis